MSKVYTLSDAHLWHPLVSNLRGFLAVQDHVAALEDAVRARVTKRDHMWWTGDMTAGGKIPQMLDWIAALPGTHHLVLGNHDPAHPMHGGHSRQREYLRAFASVQTVAQRKIGGRRVVLSHFPIVGDHTERKHLDVWRPRPFDGVLLHGHTHSKDKVSTAGQTLQIHVGIDAWGMAPVSDDELLSIIEDEATPRPDCGCRYCLSFEAYPPGHFPMSTFIVCGTCGSKRCPGANDHREDCAEST